MLYIPEQMSRCSLSWSISFLVLHTSIDVSNTIVSMNRLYILYTYLQELQEPSRPLEEYHQKRSQKPSYSTTILPCKEHRPDPNPTRRPSLLATAMISPGCKESDCNAIHHVTSHLYIALLEKGICQ